MERRNLTGILLALMLSASILGMVGCPGDYIRHGKIKSFPHSPNTFRITTPVYSNEHILGLGVRIPRKRVYGVLGTPDETVWDIQAVEPVPAKGFVLSVGQVPSGFKQLIPSSDRTFTPVPGTQYVLHIQTDRLFTRYEKKWVAE